MFSNLEEQRDIEDADLAEVFKMIVEWRLTSESQMIKELAKKKFK